MKINILIFARIADIVGKREVILELPDGAYVCDACDELGHQFPGFRDAARGSAFAVNEEYIQSDQCILRDGDTLAVIPPVSGG